MRGASSAFLDTSFTKMRKAREKPFQTASLFPFTISLLLFLPNSMDGIVLRPRPYISSRHELSRPYSQYPSGALWSLEPDRDPYLGRQYADLIRFGIFPTKKSLCRIDFWDLQKLGKRSIYSYLSVQRSHIPNKAWDLRNPMFGMRPTWAPSPASSMTYEHLTDIIRSSWN